MSEEEFYSKALSFDEVGMQVDIFEKEKAKYQQQITQLTNNWNELEKYLKGLIDNFKEDVSTPILHEQLAIEMIYEYMQEIKEGNK